MRKHLTAVAAALAFLLVASGCAQRTMVPPVPLHPQQPQVQADAVPSATSFRVLRSMGTGYDGAYPDTDLTVFGGALFGATHAGGSNLDGAIFRITPTGNERVVHSFDDATDGEGPQASLLLRNGIFYGLTTEGGKYDGGTLFQFNPKTGAVRVIYNFGSSATDAAVPYDRLVSIGSTFYGTSTKGGSFGYGTVWSVTMKGTERILLNFSGNDGEKPTAGLVNVNGTLYGTASDGGAYGYGTAYSITTSGKLRVLHMFGNGTDGRSPVGGLLYSGGTLYGATYGGGTSAYYGTVYSLKPNGTEKILYNFASGTDAQSPIVTLTLLNGTLYGTSVYGGTTGYGTVFSVNVASHKERVLHSFTGATDGSYPEAGLTYLKGMLYGTTLYGGTNNEGTVFAISP